MSLRASQLEDIRWTPASTLHVRYDDPYGRCNPHLASWVAVECEYAPITLPESNPTNR